ncbi:hypothetical protein SAMN05444388_11095 [Flavobacterium johnsoniae]|uniref:Uncharacterized protein n=1 Tax=Flavobacterium johnsoniae TaxID=986 RepID=A0A1M5SR79_FLAJO|nr:hypothetical protein SAMN05444388_11095 [Flavobacterium johnsoniae]
MKKIITPASIIIFFWGLLLLVISELYPDYTRYYLYLSIVLIIPFMTANLVRQKREDKINGTVQLQSSMYSILISAVILGVLFFIIYRLN